MQLHYTVHFSILHEKLISYCLKKRGTTQNADAVFDFRYSGRRRKFSDFAAQSMLHFLMPAGSVVPKWIPAYPAGGRKLLTMGLVVSGYFVGTDARPSMLGLLVNPDFRIQQSRAPQSPALLCFFPALPSPFAPEATLWLGSFT